MTMQNKMWNRNEGDLHALALKKTWEKALYLAGERGQERWWGRREDSDSCVCNLSVCAGEVERGCVLPDAPQS